MTLTFADSFKIHEDALKLRTQRASILASNIANADTPGYQARDIHFKQLLLQSTDALKNPVSMTVTKKNLGLEEGGNAPELKYRTALQPSLDGNTVDSQVEKSEYLKNATNYMASLQFLERHLRELTMAIRGE